MAEGQYFKSALSDFTTDVAYGSAVRHMADLGYDIDRICAELLYPAPRARVEELLQRYREEKAALAASDQKKVSYVKEVGPYGRVSFRQVKE